MGWDQVGIAQMAGSWTARSGGISPGLRPLLLWNFILILIDSEFGIRLFFLMYWERVLKLTWWSLHCSYLNSNNRHELCSFWSRRHFHPQYSAAAIVLCPWKILQNGSTDLASPAIDNFCCFPYHCYSSIITSGYQVTFDIVCAHLACPSTCYDTQFSPIVPFLNSSRNPVYRCPPAGHAYILRSAFGAVKPLRDRYYWALPVRSKQTMTLNRLCSIMPSTSSNQACWVSYGW